MSTQLQLVPEEAVQDLTARTSELEATAKALVIKDEESLRQATDILGWIATLKKQVEERRQFFTKPLNDQVRRINDFFKEMLRPLETADRILREKVLAYRQEQEKKRREEEARLRKMLEKEQKRMEREAAKQGLPAPPPIPAPTASVAPQPKTIEASLGAVSAKLVWDFEIEDETKIPREFLMVNEKAIRAAIKAGVRHIPGVRIFQREELAVRPKGV